MDLVRRTCAQPKSTRCTPVIPSIWRVAAQGQLVCHQRDRQPPRSPMFLAHGERTVHSFIAVPFEIAWHEGVVRSMSLAVADSEFGAVRVAPPVDQAAVAVILGALVVESVADFRG